jgi:hypothetical protein
MRNRIILAVATGLILAWGSGPAAAQEAGDKPSPAAAQEAGDKPTPVDHSGLYEVKGVTLVPSTGDRREIKGTITLSQEGDTYTSTFSLTTLFPFVESPMEADVIGTGEGIVMSTVPGVDPGFAFVPRTVGPRLVSANVGHFHEDGSIEIQIENAPAPGETYVPTRTTLRGARVARSPTVDSPPGGEPSPEPAENP